MADTVSKPPAARRKAIIDRIQSHEHDVLTTTEVADGITEVGRRQVKRNLRWMNDHGMINGRQITEAETWLWWISAEAIFTEDTVASAKQVGNLLSDLYDSRWEFRVIGFGVALLMALLSLSFWAAIVTVLDIDLLSPTTMLLTLVSGYVLALVVIVFGLFIFPVETLGNWPQAVDSSEDRER